MLMKSELLPVILTPDGEKESTWISPKISCGQECLMGVKRHEGEQLIKIKNFG